MKPIETITYDNLKNLAIDIAVEVLEEMSEKARTNLVWLDGFNKDRRSLILIRLYKSGLNINDVIYKKVIKRLYDNREGEIIFGLDTNDEKLLIKNIIDGLYIIHTRDKFKLNHKDISSILKKSDDVISFMKEFVLYGLSKFIQYLVAKVIMDGKGSLDW